MKRCLCLLLSLLLLCGAASAAEAPPSFEGRSLEQIMADFMEEYGLGEDNFSLSYYNTVTGEGYAFADDVFQLAASTYKLPLNMYFYELQRRGELTGDTIITWTNRTLDEIHRQSLVYSNNELSEALIYYWGDFVTYKENMRTYFTMTDEEIPPVYYDNSRGNFFCVRMMMEALQYLYENRADFAELIGYLKEAQPGEYFKRDVQEYEVAHKYGYLDCCQNDVGIIFTPQPILLAVYTRNVAGGEALCGKAARLLTDYTVWQASQTPEPEPEPEPEAVPEAEPEPEPIPPAQPAPETPAAEQTPARPQLLLIPAAAVGIGLWLVLGRRKN